MFSKQVSKGSLLTVSALSVLTFLVIWELVCRIGVVDPIFCLLQVVSWVRERK